MPLRRFQRPLWIPANAPPLFPDPREFHPEGLIAGGGDLSPARLLSAYRAGIFPWFNEPPILWWSPDPRAVIDPEHLHVSKSLLRTLRKTSWTVHASFELDPVLEGCAERPEGTWLTAEMHAAYAELGRLGRALAYEVRDGEALVGGLYGVWTDGLFAAESKFHRARDASKVALVAAVTHLFALGVELFDVQFLTEHLGSLGVYEISRDEYLARLHQATSRGAFDEAPGPSAPGRPPVSDAPAAPDSPATAPLSPPPPPGHDLLPWVLEKLAETKR